MRTTPGQSTVIVGESSAEHAKQNEEVKNRSHGRRILYVVLVSSHCLLNKDRKRLVGTVYIL